VVSKPNTVPSPTKEEKAKAKASCAPLFETHVGPEGRKIHGDLLGPLVVELDSIIYRETRQAPQSGK
jgi:hypothetical protein